MKFCHTRSSRLSKGPEPFEHLVITSTRACELHVRNGDRNGARIVGFPRRVDVQRSDADDVDEIAESGEVVGISGVDSEAVGVRGGRDEQVCDTPSM